MLNEATGLSAAFTRAAQFPTWYSGLSNQGILTTRGKLHGTMLVAVGPENDRDREFRHRARPGRHVQGPNGTCNG